MSLQCKFCSSNFKERKNLYVHMRGKHDIIRSVNVYKTCDICGIRFRKKCRLRSHIYKIHILNTLAKDDPILNVVCFTCRAVFKSFEDINMHYLTHEIKLCSQSLAFNSPEEFNSWLLQYQKDSQHLYEPCQAVRKHVSYPYTLQYFCDDLYSEKMSLHSSGTKKLRFCPAGMTVLFKRADCISVTLYETHIGHGTDENFCNPSFVEDHLEDAETRPEAGLTLESCSSFDLLQTTNGMYTRDAGLMLKTLFNSRNGPILENVVTQRVPRGFPKYNLKPNIISSKVKENMFTNKSANLKLTSSKNSKELLFAAEDCVMVKTVECSVANLKCANEAQKSLTPEKTNLSSQDDKLLPEAGDTVTAESIGQIVAGLKHPLGQSSVSRKSQKPVRSNQKVRVVFDSIPCNKNVKSAPKLKSCPISSKAKINVEINSSSMKESIENNNSAKKDTLLFTADGSVTVESVNCSVARLKYTSENKHTVALSSEDTVKTNSATSADVTFNPVNNKVSKPYKLRKRIPKLKFGKDVNNTNLKINDKSVKRKHETGRCFICDHDVNNSDSNEKEKKMPNVSPDINDENLFPDNNVRDMDYLPSKTKSNNFCLANCSSKSKSEIFLAADKSVSIQAIDCKVSHLKCAGKPKSNSNNVVSFIPQKPVMGEVFPLINKSRSETRVSFSSPAHKDDPLVYKLVLNKKEKFMASDESVTIQAVKAKVANLKYADPPANKHMNRKKITQKANMDTGNNLNHSNKSIYLGRNNDIIKEQCKNITANQKQKLTNKNNEDSNKKRTGLLLQAEDSVTVESVDCTVANLKYAPIKPDKDLRSNKNQQYLLPEAVFTKGEPGISNTVSSNELVGLISYPFSIKYISTANCSRWPFSNKLPKSTAPGKIRSNRQVNQSYKNPRAISTFFNEKFRVKKTPFTSQVKIMNNNLLKSIISSSSKRTPPSVGVLCNKNSSESVVDTHSLLGIASPGLKNSDNYTQWTKNQGIHFLCSDGRQESVSLPKKDIVQTFSKRLSFCKDLNVAVNKQSLSDKRLEGSFVNDPLSINKIENKPSTFKLNSALSLTTDSKLTESTFSVKEFNTQTSILNESTGENGLMSINCQNSSTIKNIAVKKDTFIPSNCDEFLMKPDYGEVGAYEIVINEQLDIERVSPFE